MKKNSILLAAFILSISTIFSQGFPDEMYFSDTDHILYTGDKNVQGFYEEDQLDTIFISFAQPNWWSLLESNEETGTDLEADLVYDGETYPSVGVRFKGNTSYDRLDPWDEKMSFNITLDYLTDGQDVGGYETLNLNNCFQDPSFIREVFYLNAIRNHIAAAKGNYVQLYLNGENWGIYPNIQQLNAEFIREWFTDSDGTRWRAISPDGVGGPGGPGGPPGGGGNWGNGTTALNYVGADESDYTDYYTLKSSTVESPWQDLISVCNTLNNDDLSGAMASTDHNLDIDRALWFLASEVLFTDDDGYVYKGIQDYYLYYDIVQQRMIPLEFDGNSCMAPNKYNWSPFHNETDVNYPLMNKLFAIPELRQRYLAHFRTLVEETFEPSIAHAKMEEYEAFIDAAVNADPKKLESYSAFLNEVDELKDFITDRYNFLQTNSEYNQTGPAINNSSYETNGSQWVNPDAFVAVDVVADISHNSGISTVYLYYASGIEGSFTRTAMYDDGSHNDGNSGDGTYGAEIPGQSGGTTVRYYIEASANNSDKTATYLPVGAEHNVFAYQVNSTATATSTIVINEFMAKNSTTATDEAGEYDDWIELYNVSGSLVDISGWNITDNEFNLTKFTIPEGTSIASDEYLIIWADEDGDQGDLHANFKLSGSGESIHLLNTSGELEDQVIFTEQSDDIAYARLPNGTGDFTTQVATFGYNNNSITGIDEDVTSIDFQVFPNPTSDMVNLAFGNQNQKAIEIHNMLGELVYQITSYDETISVNVSDWSKGVYVVKAKNTGMMFIVN